jgi:hypothetical protein
VTHKRVSIEGYSPEEILGMPDGDFVTLVHLGRPIVFTVGSAELLGEMRIDGERLVAQLAHVDGGGEGVLPTLFSLCSRYAQIRGLKEVEWRVNAVNCARPNPKLRRVLERRGFHVEHLPDRGQVYRLVEPANKPQQATRRAGSNRGSRATGRAPRA